jgi:hypothetical protein
MRPLVDEHRMRYDPSARAGIPPHITVMYPFLAPSQLTEVTLRELDDLLGTVERFDYSVVAVREFESGIQYLAVEPEAPFLAITASVGERFRVQPYGGVYTRLVPHLTVSQDAAAFERQRIESALTGFLPSSCVASQVWLMVGHSERSWRPARVIDLHHP